MTTPDPDPEPADDDASAVRVLVVSTDDNVAAFLASLLERAGFDAVAGPADGAAAKTTTATPPYDLVLVDTDTKPVRSIRLLADPQRARTRIAVLGSADADDGAEDLAVAAGTNHWIARPIDDTDLISAVRAAASS